MYITFTNPKYLVLLFVIPLFILIYLFSLRKSKRKALSFANFEAISRVKGIEIFSKNITVFLLNIFIAVLLVLAVSGLTLHMQANASEFSFIIAIDSSSSMEANDLSPNRLEAAKQISKQFVDGAPGTTEIGVLSFSGNAFIRESITDNKEQVKSAIDSIEISKIEGTDLYEAIVTSTNLLYQSEALRAIILLSDGQINVGTIEDAINYANENDVLIHTIAIGTEIGGETSLGESKVNKEALQALAYNTEGKFFDATNTDELNKAFAEVLKITKKKVSENLTPYLILISIFLLIVEYFLTNIRYRIFP